MKVLSLSLISFCLIGSIVALPTNGIIEPNDALLRRGKEGTQIAEGWKREKAGTQIAEGWKREKEGTQIAEGWKRAEEGTQIAEGW